ncbi:MAG TPA: TIGR03960 family B12-binding radical SAM protein [Vicinamibacteria bacterium]|nr:TIGR03960 family B12-binding radical SAM protein [Vicinamibacteria bacterium]
MNVREHPYASFIHEVSKPARYMGGERFSVVKDWSSLDATLALAFPDVYDIGMSHQGTKILYSVINKEPDLCLERAFCPWFDLEEQLRRRGLPLVSLETHRPLSAFDIVGFSLQYELTFTNVLTMLELGGIPLRNADRTLEHPLVIAGGPVATQPEPMSRFIDLFLIGDAERRLPRLMRHYAELRRGKLEREDILAELSREGGVYCPDLYEREECPRSSLLCVSGPKREDLPKRVERAFVEDINRYPYPDDSPVPVAEAIFDRMSVEIARGCTEGCRFCQAGMIYRPVRERDPEQVVDTLVSALEKGGYDEAALTSLSTADYSCISPLVKQVMKRLRPRKVALGISSLRAYGLDEALLDDISSVKATGLTFAPEAGTQRMRDVVNKNITEEDIFTTCHRVFSRGWSKVKLYFMIGLPTELDEDVLGIAEMGSQARDIGRRYNRRKIQVTVSVSSHVPKPHTPFQWCAQDSMREIERKQAMLRRESKARGLKLRLHDHRVSHLEGIIARGDARVAGLIERAWRLGARFDGWDEHLAWDVWSRALSEWEAEERLSRERYLGTLPVDGRLPWDHVDVGLADGFLEKEYRRSLKGRFSPPCGKPYEAKVHHTNLEDALRDERKLVCYHCGVACDLGAMRKERLVFLDKMGARTKPAPSSRETSTERAHAHERVARGLAPHDFAQGAPVRYRMRYRKTNPMSLRGHLDMIRVLGRVLRRASLSLYHTEGFSPRPLMTFGPALALGMQSEAEYVDFALVDARDAELVAAEIRSASEPGLELLGLRRLAPDEPALTKRIQALDYVVVLPDSSDYEARLARFDSSESVPVSVRRKGKERTVDAKTVVLEARLTPAGGNAALLDVEEEAMVLALRVSETSGQASLRPIELVKAILDVELPPQCFSRTGCWTREPSGSWLDPLDAIGDQDVGSGLPVLSTDIAT